MGNCGDAWPEPGVSVLLGGTRCESIPRLGEMLAPVGAGAGWDEAGWMDRGSGSEGTAACSGRTEQMSP